VITGHVFDASALADLVTGKTIYVRARVRASIAEQATIVVPAAALTRAWQIVPDFGRAALERLPQMETISIDELDEVIAQQAGLLTGNVPNAPDLTIDAAQAAWSARWRRWPLVTANPQQYATIPGLRIEPLP
jgi:predicted nucleic acid-binding protein